MTSATPSGENLSQSSTQPTRPTLPPTPSSNPRPATSNARPSTSTRGASSDSQAMTCTLVGTPRNTSMLQLSPPRRASTVAYAQSLALPRTWNSAMDRLICQLDAQDAGLDVTFKELKRQFPAELGQLVLAKEAIATRLELLEWRLDWDGWKAGLQMQSVGRCDGAVEERDGSGYAGLEKDLARENEKTRLADVVRKYENPVGAEHDCRDGEKGRSEFSVLTRPSANGRAVGVEGGARPGDEEEDPFTPTTGTVEEANVWSPHSFLRSRAIGGLQGLGTRTLFS